MLPKASTVKRQPAGFSAAFFEFLQHRFRTRHDLRGQARQFGDRNAVATVGGAVSEFVAVAQDAGLRRASVMVYLRTILAEITAARKP